MHHPLAEPQAIARALGAIPERMVAFRRDVHAHPELAWGEVRTSARVVEELRASGLSPVTTAGGTGIVCDVSGDTAGPTVAVRADLDALPVQDEKDVPYRSSVDGVAHACGHDVHTSVLLGTGLCLARLAASGALPGRVRLLFQPAEEVMPGGALSMLDADALEGVQRVFSLHCDPRLDAGAIGLRDGPVTGATDLVTVRLSGAGGHTARPQMTVDVVAALADVVVRTPLVLSRRADPRAGLSLIWGMISAGSAPNVIPQSGMVSGSVRTLDRESWKLAEKLIPTIIRDVVSPYQAVVDVDYVQGVPPAVNDVVATAGFRSAAASVLGEDAVLHVEQSMGAEDFAWMLDRVPGVLARLGVRRPGAVSAPDLHRGDFDVDEDSIACGIRVLLAATLEALATL